MRDFECGQNQKLPRQHPDPRTIDESLRHSRPEVSGLLATSGNKTLHPPRALVSKTRAQFVLPYSKDAPACLPQGPRNQTVTGFVRRKFGPPEIGIVFRLRGMQRTAMPETAIHEDGNTKLRKNEIRLSEHGLLAPPAVDTVFPKNLHQRQFGILVSTRSNTRHDLGAFGFAEDVRHRMANCRSNSKLPSRFTLHLETNLNATFHSPTAQFWADQFPPK